MFEKRTAEKKLDSMLDKRHNDYARKKDELQAPHARELWSLEWDQSILPLQEDYDEVLTRHYRRKANQKLVEMPPRCPDDERAGEGYWYEAQFSRELLLTDKGVKYVRTEIRRETLDEREMFFRYATVLFAAIAAIASITGALN